VSLVDDMSGTAMYRPGHLTEILEEGRGVAVPRPSARRRPPLRAFADYVVSLSATKSATMKASSVRIQKM
jgi:hypothetical protein